MLHGDILSIAIQINQTTMIVGPPGVGKTAITKELVKQLEERRYGGKPFPLVFQSLAQIMPEDLAGAQVPNHETKTMDAYMMGSIKSLLDAKQGVYFGDEYGSCSPMVRAAFLNAAQDRLFGDTHLPNVAVVCAMNPPDIATNGQDMTAPESNRFFWLTWELNNKDWFDWLIGGKGAVSSFPIVPTNWKVKHLPKAKSLIMSFLKTNPMLIHQMPTADKATAPWPSHRSWTNAAGMFAAVLACGYPLASDHVHAAVAGCVGGGAADTFFAWVKDMDLPDPEKLLNDPKNAIKLLPERHDRAMACLESVAAAAIEDHGKDTKKRWDAAWEILEPVLKTHQDRVMSAARILASRIPPGAVFPKMATDILHIRREMGISKNTSITST